AQELLDTGAQPRVSRTLLLLKLTLGVGQITLQRLDLLASLAQFGVERLQVFMDLVPVESPEHHVEFPYRGVFEEVVELGIDVGLHGGSSLVGETATRPDGVRTSGAGDPPPPRSRTPMTGPTSGDRQRTPPLPS